MRARIEALSAFLDGPAYAAEVSWDEHVVLAYRHARGRGPSPVEFHLLAALKAHHGMTRGEALAVAMREDGKPLTWEACAAFVEKSAESDFTSSDAVRQASKRLAATSGEALRAALRELRVSKISPPAAMAPPAPAKQQAPGVVYQCYFGFLHAHSHLSLDAQGAPEEAYRYAREEGGLDFFALTDHGVFLDIWPWDRKWETLRAAADAHDAPGEFAALWGFEWSNPFLGHISVINTPAFTDTVSTFALEDFYDWLTAYPEGFGRFNHPGSFDYTGMEFHHFDAHAPAIEQMCGIETWNARGGFGRYHYAGTWGGAPSYPDAANRRGWRVGALGAEDNHRGQWGTLTEFRTAVLAESLDREAVLDAYRARRFYATEDKNLFLDVRCQGYPMGARLSGEERVFEVTVRDGGGDTFREARLYRNGEHIATAPLSGSEDSVSFNDPERTGADYYYVIVTQTDDNDGDGRGDEAISSPIWFGEVPPSSVGCAAVSQGATSHAADLVFLLGMSALLLYAGFLTRHGNRGMGLGPSCNSLDYLRALLS